MSLSVVVGIGVGLVGVGGAAYAAPEPWELSTKPSDFALIIGRPADCLEQLDGQECPLTLHSRIGLHNDDHYATYSITMTTLGGTPVRGGSTMFGSFLTPSSLDPSYELNYLERPIPDIARGSYWVRTNYHQDGHWWCSEYNPDGCSWIEATNWTVKHKVRWNGSRLFVLPYKAPATSVTASVRKDKRNRVNATGTVRTALERADYSRAPASAARGALVRLQMTTKSGWRNRAAVRTNSRGQFKFRVKAPRKRTYWRVVVVRTTKYPSAATSSVRR